MTLMGGNSIMTFQKAILKIWYIVSNTQKHKICKIKKKIHWQFFLASRTVLLFNGGINVDVKKSNVNIKKLHDS